MPFRSQAQRAWMYANHPAMARRWEKHTPEGKLPEHVAKRRTKLRKKYKVVGSEPGALIRAAQEYRRSSIKDKKTFGETDTDQKTMKINKHLARTVSDYGGKQKRSNAGVLDAIVHEAMHAAHPKAHEKTVRKRTKTMKKNLTPGQKRQFYALFKKKRT